MSKRIVFCADGTWDTSANKSNVYTISKAVQQIAGEQVVFYDDGVGADGNPIEKLTGGAFGLGLNKKIKEGYSQISNVYEPNDEIYIFGFSRGAYTARSLAGMIAVCGLPTQQHTEAMVETAFDAYRRKDHRDAALASLKDFGLFNAKITMVGVWDTVGSLGIPALFGGISPLLYGFLDTNLHEDVLNAYHALSIDERREQFPATLWTGPFKQGQAVEQVYFSGVHCDVGGGYGDDESGTALSDIPLSWMISKAAALGLKFAPEALALYPSPIGSKYSLDTKHESWKVFWGFPKNRTISSEAAISNSVVIRCQEDETYRPRNLKLTAGVPSTDYSVIKAVVETAGVAKAAGA